MADDQSGNVPNPSRRALFAAFRLRPKPAEKTAGEVSVVPTAKELEDAPLPIIDKPVDRRLFMQTAGAVVASLAGNPSSALDLLKEGGPDWLVGVAKTLEECWGSAAYMDKLVGPLIPNYRLAADSSQICTDVRSGIKAEASRCADLLHIASQHPKEFAALQKAGGVGTNPLINKILSDATGAKAKLFGAMFQTVSKGNMTLMPRLSKQLLKPSFPRGSSRNGAPKEEISWQDREKERIANEKAWYDYWP